MAKKKDTKLFWFGLAALGGYLWWRSKQSAMPPAFPAVSPPTQNGGTSATPSPTVSIGTGSHTPVAPGANYAVVKSAEWYEPNRCVDIRTNQSVSMSRCDAAKLSPWLP